MVQENSSKVLLIDDDCELVDSLRRALRTIEPGVSFYGATSPDEAISLARAHRPQACVLDLSLDGRGPESGIALLERFLELDPTVRVIVLTGHGSTELGVRALRLGAASFLDKPPHLPHLHALVLDGVRQADLKRRALEGLAATEYRLARFLSWKSESMKRVGEQLVQAAQTNQAVLLTGETGTGKGVCARAIHEASARRAFRFVRYQPTFSSGDLVNSDLFGHTRGSFTGANADRKGLLLEAHRGTLFLDEIDEFPLASQVLLLGVLQERRFRPLGSNTELPSDFRLVSASNRSVKESIEGGKLRADLFYRLAHVHIELPPLRERKEDIPLLVRSILDRVNDEQNINVFEITSGALQMLAGHEWRGNVRELEHFIGNAAFRAYFTGRTFIAEDDLSMHIKDCSAAEAGNLLERVEAFRKKLIVEALAKHGGNISRASRTLGVDRMVIRNTLKKMKGDLTESSAEALQ